MISDRRSNAEPLEGEVVIIGGGAAGLAAAVTAAEQAANVLLLEKLNAPGGNATMAEGFLPQKALLKGGC